MAEDRQAYERHCKNPKCRVRTFDAGNDIFALEPCPACGEYGNKDWK